MFIAALWSPAGKGLTSWISWFSCVSVTFPCGVLGQVWYLIVSITDLCLLTYFEQFPGHLSLYGTPDPPLFMAINVYYNIEQVL